MADKFYEFLSKLQNADESERSWIVMDFCLKSLSDSLQGAVWAAAIPYSFDQEFLNALLDEPISNDDFTKLTKLSFVEPWPDHGFDVHGLTRKLLIAKLWADNKPLYQKISQRAAAYCKQQDQRDTDWRIKTIYHKLLIGDPVDTYDFHSQCAVWISVSNDKLERLVRVGLDAASHGILSESVTDLVDYWQGQLSGSRGMISPE